LLAVVEANTVTLALCTPDCTLLIIFGKRAVQIERTVAPRRAAEILNVVAREEVECDMTKLEMERAINPTSTLIVLSSIPPILCRHRGKVVVELVGRSGVDSDGSMRADSGSETRFSSIGGDNNPSSIPHPIATRYTTKPCRKKSPPVKSRRPFKAKIVNIEVTRKSRQVYILASGPNIMRPRSSRSAMEKAPRIFAIVELIIFPRAREGCC